MFNSTGSGPSFWQLPCFITIGTGYYHQLVYIASTSFGTGWWFKPVAILTHWNRLEPPPGANCPPLGWSKAKGTSCCCSRYRWVVLLFCTDDPFSSSATSRLVTACVCSRPKILARPMSEILGFMFSSSRMLLALRSRCTTLSWESSWRYCRARAMPFMIL